MNAILNQIVWWTTGLLFVAAIGWVLYGWLKRTEDPWKLVAKWAVTGVMGYITVRIGAANSQGGGIAEALVIGITCAICGIVLGITWGANIGGFVARPLTSLFDDGNREVEPRPLYSIAESKRKQGRYAAAVAEIRRQIDLFPDDFQGMMLLAEIQAENLRDIEAARATVERVVATPGRDASSVAAALNFLADWNLKFAGDREAAREALERVRTLLPESEWAYLASQRIAHLATPEMIEDKREPHRVKLGEYEKRVGLRTEPLVIAPPREDPASATLELVRHLEEHPQDGEARERLAKLYASHYHRLDLAIDQIEQMVGASNIPARRAAQALNVMADLQIRHGNDLEGARSSLQRIVDRYPNTALAETAKSRMNYLPLELRANQKSRVVPFGSPAPEPTPPADGISG